MASWGVVSVLLWGTGELRLGFCGGLGLGLGFKVFRRRPAPLECVADVGVGVNPQPARAPLTARAPPPPPPRTLIAPPVWQPSTKGTTSTPLAVNTGVLLRR